MPRDRHEAAHALKSSILLPRPDRRTRVVREHREQAGLQVLHGRRDRRGMGIALCEIEPARVEGVHAPAVAAVKDDGSPTMVAGIAERLHAGWAGEHEAVAPCQTHVRFAAGQAPRADLNGVPHPLTMVDASGQDQRCVAGFTAEPAAWSLQRHRTDTVTQIGREMKASRSFSPSQRLKPQAVSTRFSSAPKGARKLLACRMDEFV